MTSTKKTTDFIPFIHILHGIAALIVVWSHLVGTFIYEFKYAWEPWALFYNWLMLPFNLYQGGGRFAVILFFLISGYVISLVAERENQLEFFIKRVFRIFPPLIFAVFVMCICNIILEQNGLPLVFGTNSTRISD